MEVMLPALLPLTGDEDSGQLHGFNYEEVPSANVGWGWKSAVRFMS
jgi:hypothetical protein